MSLTASSFVCVLFFIVLAVTLDLDLSKQQSFNRISSTINTMAPTKKTTTAAKAKAPAAPHKSYADMIKVSIGSGYVGCVLVRGSCFAFVCGIAGP